DDAGRAAEDGDLAEGRLQQGDAPQPPPAALADREAQIAREGIDEPRLAACDAAEARVEPQRPEERVAHVRETRHERVRLGLADRVGRDLEAGLAGGIVEVAIEADGETVERHRVELEIEPLADTVERPPHAHAPGPRQREIDAAQRDPPAEAVRR